MFFQIICKINVTLPLSPIATSELDILPLVREVLMDIEDVNGCRALCFGSDFAFDCPPSERNLLFSELMDEQFVSCDGIDAPPLLIAKDETCQ